ncbi:MAG: tetratricopeptide repeat protein [Nevskia sp.]|nr:tetratricopeptide repeat protein [Nevskia sp.]
MRNPREHEYAEEPARRKPSRVGLVLAAVALLLVYGGMRSYFSGRASAAAALAGTAFLKQIALGPELAYDSTAQAFRDQQSKESFGSLSRQLALDEIDDVSWSHRSASGSTASLSGSVTLRRGSRLMVEMTVVREGEVWRVSGMSIAGGSAFAPVPGARYEDAASALARQDYPLAFRLLRPFADQGMAVAQFNLGVLYAQGYGTQADPAESMKWFEKAAAQNNADAQNALGIFYRDGNAVAAADPAQAAEWFRKAAEQNQADAEYNLAALLDVGSGVPQDKAQAIKLYQAAADQDLPAAQYRLGVHYANGDGVQADRVQAYKWFALAARQNVTEARDEMEKVSASLTDEQRSQADAQVAAWQPK